MVTKYASKVTPELLTKTWTPGVLCKYVFFKYWDPMKSSENLVLVYTHIFRLVVFKLSDWVFLRRIPWFSATSVYSVNNSQNCHFVLPPVPPDGYVCREPEGNGQAMLSVKRKSPRKQGKFEEAKFASNPTVWKGTLWYGRDRYVGVLSLYVAVVSRLSNSMIPAVMESKVMESCHHHNRYFPHEREFDCNS